MHDNNNSADQRRTPTLRAAINFTSQGQRSDKGQRRGHIDPLLLTCEIN